MGVGGFSQMWEKPVDLRGGEYSIFKFFSVVSAVFIGVCDFSFLYRVGNGISGTGVALLTTCTGGLGVLLKLVNVNW